jgi:hypothetical protein
MPIPLSDLVFRRSRRDHRPAIQPSERIGLFCILQLMIADQPMSVPNGGYVRASTRDAGTLSDRAGRC